jgi:hypothetical protein
MEAVTGNLLPDIASVETANIAGETALMTGHLEPAITYLDLAISGNPTISRIHGMRADKNARPLGRGALKAGSLHLAKPPFSHAGTFGSGMTFGSGLLTR